MNKTDMIEALLNASAGSPAVLETRRRQLQGMTSAGLEREMLLRGLADYDEPEDSDYEDDLSDEPASAVFLGIARELLYAD